MNKGCERGTINLVNIHGKFMWHFLPSQTWLSHTNVWMHFYWHVPNKYCDLTVLPVLKQWILRPCYWIWGLAHCFFFDSFRRRDAPESQVLRWACLQKSPPELLPSWHLVWNGECSAACLLTSWKSVLLFHEIIKERLFICQRIINDLLFDHFSGVFNSSLCLPFSAWT